MPYIIQNQGTPHERICDLRYGVNTIGRGLDNSIVVEDDARSLSRHHAEIQVTDKGIFVTDLNSSNGTLVNQIKIAQQKLNHNDLVQFGSVIFRLVDELKIEASSSGSEINAIANPTNASSGLSILMRVSPEKSRVNMQDLLKQNIATSGSVLMIQESDEAQRTSAKLRVLLEVSQELSSPEAYSALPEKILELLLKIMSVDRAVLLLIDEKTGNLEPKAAKFSNPNATANLDFYSRKIANFVLKQGDAIISDDASGDRRFDSSQSIIQQSIQAAMCAPLKPRDRTIGVLYVDNLSHGHAYHKEDLEFLSSLANQAAIAIENANLYQSMQSEVIRRTKLERFFPAAVSQKIEEGWDLNRIIETEVTALFSDISGFTEMTAPMQPRKVLEFLNEYFKVMVEDIVFPFGGTLEKYIADALLAVWGSPYQRDDDAIMAVNAAIAMQWAMRKLNEDWTEQGRDLQIQIHIGLNTGMVASGNIGSENLIQYTNIGDTMNVASRICTAAQAGDVFISESTKVKIESLHLPLEKLDLIKVKGKEEPLQLYRILWEQIDIRELSSKTKTIFPS
ncbi:adenylate/guanylate cyclase domain-containing protein [Pseudanabaena sp. UWO310]|uniref:adenylate/guanylate cyclase domain-containing protein n=1 Tax=Pseudanabaena sp. UWO310 TaxID=2480795 RepID=UPI001157A403|nr:adenylate/guanylate cyclase domain-containing protein [Pseudanabaena sp. UWO310]TYQ31944.1 FHA domain-containing protein [Pseudanabaena sp. UWO310]